MTTTMRELNSMAVVTKPGVVPSRFKAMAFHLGVLGVDGSNSGIHIESDPQLVLTPVVVSCVSSIHGRTARA